MRLVIIYSSGAWSRCNSLGGEIIRHLDTLSLPLTNDSSMLVRIATNDMPELD